MVRSSIISDTSVVVSNNRIMKSFISQINKNRKKTDFENGNPMEYWNFWRCTSGGVFFINLYKSETINVQKEL